MKPEGRTNAAGEYSQGTTDSISKDETLRRIASALDQVKNGEVIIKIQGGKPIWVDKYDRERVG